MNRALLIALLGACTGEAPPPVEEPATDLASALRVCDRYEGSAHGFCLSRMSAMVEEAELDAVCEAAAPWSGDCRRGWVEPRLRPDSGASTAKLRAACAGEHACLLDVADHRPQADFAQQLTVCEGLGPNAPHCVSHGVQRWRRSSPRQAELARIGNYDGPLAEWLGFKLAEVVRCDAPTACAGSAATRRACEERLATLEAAGEPCVRSHGFAGQAAPPPLRAGKAPGPR